MSIASLDRTWNIIIMIKLTSKLIKSLIFLFKDLNHNFYED